MAATQEKDKLNADLEELRNDFKALKDDLNAVLKDTGQLAAAQGEAGLKKGQSLADELSKTASQQRGQVEEQVKENPLLALGLAFGTGALLGVLARR